jgi:hypothetical protein
MGRATLGQGILRALRFSPIDVFPPILRANHQCLVVLQLTALLNIASLEGKAKLTVSTFRSMLGTDKWELAVHPATFPQHMSIDPLVHSTSVDPPIHNISP